MYVSNAHGTKIVKLFREIFWFRANHPDHSSTLMSQLYSSSDAFLA